MDVRSLQIYRSWDHANWLDINSVTFPTKTPTQRRVQWIKEMRPNVCLLVMYTILVRHTQARTQSAPHAQINFADLCASEATFRIIADFHNVSISSGSPNHFMRYRQQCYIHCRPMHMKTQNRKCWRACRDVILGCGNFVRAHLPWDGLIWSAAPPPGCHPLMRVWAKSKISKGDFCCTWRDHKSEQLRPVRQWQLNCKTLPKPQASTDSHFMSRAILKSVDDTVHPRSSRFRTSHHLTVHRFVAVVACPFLNVFALYDK